MRTTSYQTNRYRSVTLGAQRVRRTLKAAFTAFTTGARLIPLGDNGKLLKSLAAKSTAR